MIYDEYKKKIEKVKQILVKVRRYRILILAVLSAVVLAVTGFMVANGMVYGDSSCPASVVYGKEFTYKANAFMKKVSFEYSPAYSENWQSTLPTKPGKYKVRAYAIGTFGIKRCGKEHLFEVKPKEISVSVLPILEYGEEFTLSAELVNGDRLECDSFIYHEILQVFIKHN